jgi:hypothetical protein
MGIRCCTCNLSGHLLYGRLTAGVWTKLGGAQLIGTVTMLFIFFISCQLCNTGCPSIGMLQIHVTLTAGSFLSGKYFTGYTQKYIQALK